MARLLVVEDDERIGRAVHATLRGDGHDVTWTPSGRQAMQLARAGTLDLALLDLGLPDIDGLEVCRTLRAAQPGCVIVILTARSDEMDVVVGLETGADDYLTKPFGLAELLARVRAHLRRRDGASAAVPTAYSFGDLILDVAARRCLVSNVDVPLRAKEFDLLERLARDAGSAVGRDTLMADVWDENWFGSTKTLDVHVAALRRRITEAATAAEAGTGAAPRLPTISTLRGHGYRLDPVPSEV